LIQHAIAAAAGILLVGCRNVVCGFVDGQWYQFGFKFVINTPLFVVSRVMMRKAAAAMDTVMCRYHACYRPDLVVVEPSFVFGCLETLLDDPAGSGDADQLGQGGAGWSVTEIGGDIIGAR